MFMSESIPLGGWNNFCDNEDHQSEIVIELELYAVEIQIKSLFYTEEPVRYISETDEDSIFLWLSHLQI